MLNRLIDKIPSKIASETLFLYLRFTNFTLIASRKELIYTASKTWLKFSFAFTFNAIHIFEIAGKAISTNFIVSPIIINAKK